MNIDNLGSGGDLLPDAYNGVRKTCRLIVETVHEAAEDLRKDDYDDIYVL